MTTCMVTGLGKGEDNVSAAEEAIETAKLQLKPNQNVNMSIVLCPPRYDCQEVVDVVRRETNRAPLIGCSAAGEFTEQGVREDSIAVGLISSDDINFYSSMVADVKKDPELAIRTLANKFPMEFDGCPYLCAIMFLNGLTGVGEEVTLLASTVFKQVFGRNVTLVGGAAGSSLKLGKPAVFSDDIVATDALSVCLLASKKPFFTGVQHGHVPVSPPLHVTRSAGCVLYEIEGKPAWTVWKEQTADVARNDGIDPYSMDDRDIDAYLLRFELGLPIEEGQYKIRLPLSKNEDGSLNFGCSIPEGATFRIMGSDRAAQIESARLAADSAMKSVSGNIEIASALIFDCACRSLILGDEYPLCVEQYRSVLGGIPMLGWATYGEICMKNGQFSGFHSASSVVLLIPG